MSDGEKKASSTNEGAVDVMLPLPEGMKPPDHQIAGHYFGKGKTKLGMLQCQDGTLVKPCQLPPRGEKEMNFYHKIFDTSMEDSMILQLREFIPQYLGMWSTALHHNVKYIKLEDITSKMHRPCVLDLKIGCVSYDPEASPEKIQREISKYPPLEKVGFRFSGMRVFNSEQSEFVTTDRKTLFTYKAKEVLTCGFTSYFRPISGMSKIACLSFLRRLHKMQKWFRIQKQFAFYSSSLLLVYEGDKEKYNQPICDKCCDVVKRIVQLFKDVEFSDINHKANDHTAANGYTVTSGLWDHGKEVLLLLETPCENCDRRADVRMIDFTHVFPSSDIDNNYLYGLNSVISYLLNFLIL